MRDFSITDETVPAEHRGTYLAFTDSGSAGMQHLRRLAGAGLNTVHLLPVFDIATIPERRADQATPACDLESFGPASEEQQACVDAVAADRRLQLGLRPVALHDARRAPTRLIPRARPAPGEFRQMVAALNGAGLRVVMDVVYNHTTASGQAAKSVLDRIVPGYYHRLSATGTVETSTCCQNTATEHRMMEKLMVDSVVTWARAYKVDGFRFDLMGHHSLANMLAVREALDDLTLERDGVDGRRIYVYGEGWDFGEVAGGARFRQARQLAARSVPASAPSPTGCATPSAAAGRSTPTRASRGSPPACTPTPTVTPSTGRRSSSCRGCSCTTTRSRSGWPETCATTSSSTAPGRR